MSRKDRILCLLVCAVFGLIGGAVSNLGFLSVKPVEAQRDSGITTAQRFVVVDSNGKHLAELGNTDGRAELNFYSDSKARSSLNEHALYFYDKSGAPRLELGVFRPTAQMESTGSKEDYPVLWMLNSKGKIIYEAK